METRFASPERTAHDEIARENQAVISSDVFKYALNLFPEIVLVLDKNRQAVYANQELARLFDFKSPQDALGKRPGEIFRCIHAFDEAAGCGTSEFCRDCGAVKAILASQTGKTESQECRLTSRTPSGAVNSLDLRVWAIPITLQNETFSFFVIRDIRDEKRRAALEKIFFHDLLNDITALKGFTENLQDSIITPDKKTADGLYRTTQRIVDTVLEQRDLLAAEHGEYTLVIDAISVRNLLCEIVLFYEKSYLSRDRDLVIKCSPDDPTIQSDYTILWRILSNLIKNALEAAGKNTTVTVGYREDAGKKIFSVNNPGVMTDEVRHQVFQRSFTTKGRGRGIGTYSVRLFAEQYLKGKVWFESEEEKGTTFFVSL